VGWRALAHNEEFPGWAEKLIIGGLSTPEIDSHIELAQQLADAGKLNAASDYLRTLGIPANCLERLQQPNKAVKSNGYPDAKLISEARAAQDIARQSGTLLEPRYSDAIFFAGDPDFVTDGK
jgi:hypothetical protein